MINTTVHFVRHGEVHNPAKILYGRLPGFRLSDAGVLMAEAAASHLAGHDVVYLASSPMQRAQETARPLAAMFGLEAHTDDRLLEATNAFEGKRLYGQGSVLRHPANWPLFRNPLKPSWGEPYEQIAQRMFAAALGARDQAAGHEAVCVSHQLPIVCLRRYVQGDKLWHDPRKRQCALASITSLVFADDQVVRVDYVEPVGSTPNDMAEQPSGA
jgi:broad specificity phosphatase PhoE